MASWFICPKGSPLMLDKHGLYIHEICVSGAAVVLAPAVMFISETGLFLLPGTRRLSTDKTEASLSFLFIRLRRISAA